MKLGRWCRGDDVLEQNNRIEFSIGRSWLGFLFQSNDRFDSTEVWRKDRCLLLADLSLALRWRRAGNADARAGCIKKDVKLWRLVY